MAINIIYMNGLDMGDVASRVTTFNGSQLASYPGRFGEVSGSMGWYNGYVTKSGFANTVTMGVAAAVYIPTYTAANLISIQDGGTRQFGVRIRADGKLDWDRGGSALNSPSSGTLPGQSTWFHIQFRAAINDVSGTAEVLINGQSFMTFTGDTKQTSNAFANEFSIGDTGNVISRWDDVVVWSTADWPNSTDWPGDVRIIPRSPNGAGAYTDWTPVSGSNNWDIVNDTPLFDFITASSAGLRDLYTFPSIAGSGTVLAVQELIMAKKDDASTVTIKPLYRQGTTNASGTSFSMSDNNVIYNQLMLVNPTTGLAWVLSDASSGQFGVLRDT